MVRWIWNKLIVENKYSQKQPIYFAPLLPWLRDFTLADGYKPFDEGFAKDLAGLLQQTMPRCKRSTCWN